MAQRWHYQRGGQEHGPVTTADLRLLADSERLQPTDMVRQEGTTKWVPAGSVKGLFYAGVGRPPDRGSSGSGATVVVAVVLLLLLLAGGGAGGLSLLPARVRRQRSCLQLAALHRTAPGGGCPLLRQHSSNRRSASRRYNSAASRPVRRRPGHRGRTQGSHFLAIPEGLLQERGRGPMGGKVRRRHLPLCGEGAARNYIELVEHHPWAHRAHSSGPF